MGEAGQGQGRRPCAAAESRLGLEHDDPPAGLRENNGGGQAIRSRSDNNGVELVGHLPAGILPKVAPFAKRYDGRAGGALVYTVHVRAGARSRLSRRVPGGGESVRAASRRARTAARAEFHSTDAIRRV